MLVSNILRAQKRDPLSGFWYEEIGRLTASGMAVTPDTAMKLNAVYCCLIVVTEDIASLPLKVYRRRDDDGKDLVPDHPLYYVLHDRPNKWQTSFEFREMMQGHLELRGNAYAEIVPGPRGFVDQLWPMHPDYVRPRWTESGKIVYEIRQPGKPFRILMDDEVFHLRGLSSDGLVGLSRIELQRESIGLGLSAQEYAARLFSNDATPGGVLEHPNKLGEEAFEHLEESLAKHAGVANARKPMILEEGMKWHQLGLSNKDVEFLESRKFTRSEIAGMFRLSGHKINDLERATFSNVEHLSIAHVVDAIRPRCVRWEQAISRDLILAEGTYFAEFLLDALLRGDAIARATALQIRRRNGTLNANEWRAMENENPIGPQGEKYVIESNMQLLDRLGMQPESTNARGQIQERLNGIAKVTAERLAHKELTVVRKLIAKYSGTELDGHLAEFYGGFTEDLIAGLQIDPAAAEVITHKAQRQIALAASNGGAEDYLAGSEADRAGYFTYLVTGVQ